MRYGRVAILGIVVLLAFVLVVQNTEVVTVRFLAWELAMSRIILLSGAMLVGFVAGFLIAKLTGRKPG